MASIARILLSMPVCIESDKIYSHRVCGLDLAYSISGSSLWDFLLKYLESIVFFPIFATDMRRTEITNSIKEALKSVPYKMEARLYGSEARGDARPDSDIDLLILVDQPTVTGKDEDAIFAPLYQLELQSGVIINPLIIPKSQWGANVSPFYINVENEGVPL